MMWKAIRNRHFLLLDVVFLLLAVYASFVLRLERFHIDNFWPGAVLFGGAVLMTTLFTFRQMGVYALLAVCVSG
ncbi:MAG: hypothetical protein R3E31_08480 [Chloroflexota bacterium]